MPTRLRLSGSAAYYDTELQDEYCPGCNGDGSAWAPKGIELPVTANFKGNLVARCFDVLLQTLADLPGMPVGGCVK